MAETRNKGEKDGIEPLTLPARLYILLRIFISFLRRVSVRRLLQRPFGAARHVPLSVGIMLVVWRIIRFPDQSDHHTEHADEPENGCC